MMRDKAKGTLLFPAAMPPPAAAVKEEEWEVRPGGMLVQKRSPDGGGDAAGAPSIRVKVKFNGVHHEIYISAQASFGELKKMMSEKTGLHHDDLKVVYKDKERDAKAFLDMAGVKDRSKLVLLEDPAAQAKRLLEQRRSDKADRAAKSVSRISLDVDKLASKVAALETIVGKGGKVVEGDVVALTEALMNELVKLDAIAAEGDVKAQRRMQEKRVQKYVESLDAIRAKNGRGGGKDRAPHLPPRPPPVSQRRNFQHPTGAAPAAPPTPSWESFDLLSSAPSTSSATATTTMAAATTTTSSPIPRFDWELF